MANVARINPEGIRRYMKGFASGGAILDVRQQPTFPILPPTQQPATPALPVTQQPPATQVTAESQNPAPSVSADKQPHFPVVRLGFSNAGRIPGKVNPNVADDVTIDAKKGEYVLPVEVVGAMGGADAIDAMVKNIKTKMGLPTEVGPKMRSEPDAQGRMNAKGMRGFAGGGSLREQVEARRKDYEASPEANPGPLVISAGNLANSPAASGVKSLAVGAALPVAIANDVGARALNAGNYLLGGDSDYFNGDMTTDMLKKNAGVTVEPTTPAVPATTSQGSPLGWQGGKTPNPADLGSVVTPPVVSTAAAPSGVAMLRASTTTGREPLAPSRGVNPDGSSYDNDAAMRGIRQRQQDSAAYDQQVADANRANASEKERIANQSVASRLAYINRDYNNDNLTADQKLVLATKGFENDQKMVSDATKAKSDINKQELVNKGLVDVASITGGFHVAGAKAQHNLDPSQVTLNTAHAELLQKQAEGTLSKEEQIKLAGMNEREKAKITAKGHILASTGIDDVAKQSALARIDTAPDEVLIPGTPEVPAKKGFLGFGSRDRVAATPARNVKKPSLAEFKTAAAKIPANKGKDLDAYYKATYGG